MQYVIKDYTLTMCMGYAILKSPEGKTTETMDGTLINILREMGVPYSKVCDEAELTKMEIG